MIMQRRLQVMVTIQEYLLSTYTQLLNDESAHNHTSFRQPPQPPP